MITYEKLWQRMKELNVSPNGNINIFDDVDIGSVVTLLHSNKIKILAIKSSDESVEEFYLNLIGGGNENV